MFRRACLLLVLTTLLAAGCSIDRIEWESAGFPIEQVAHALEEEHHAPDPVVECIKREVQGAEWECRAQAADDAEFHCHVTANQPRELIYEVHCEEAHHDEEGAETAGHGDEPAAGEEGETSTTEHDEDTPAETEPAAAEDDGSEH